MKPLTTIVAVLGEGIPLEGLVSDVMAVPSELLGPERFSESTTSEQLFIILAQRCCLTYYLHIEWLNILCPPELEPRVIHRCDW